MYMGTIIDSEPTPIPILISTRAPIPGRIQLTGDKSTREDRCMASGDRSCLDDNTDDENGDIYQYSVLSREDLS